MTSVSEIYKELKAHQNPKSTEGMQRVGIRFQEAYGVKIPVLRNMAKSIGVNHKLALSLWEEPLHEAKILATMIADKKEITPGLMDKWANDFYSWDICDQCIMNYFEKSQYAYDKAIEWHNNDKEYVKRAAYAMQARLAVSDKKAEDEKFIAFFPYIKYGAKDDRNMVKKAVNWAIRQIGKRNLNLNKKAITLSEEIAPGAFWIAADALKELKSEKVQTRLIKKQ